MLTLASQTVRGAAPRRGGRPVCIDTLRQIRPSPRVSISRRARAQIRWYHRFSTSRPHTTWQCSLGFHISWSSPFCPLVAIRDRLTRA